MKQSSLILTVLAAAALAAAGGTPSPRAELRRAEPRPAEHAHVHDADVEGAAHVHAHDTDLTGDPHAGLYAATAPHAALHDADPHLALHAAVHDDSNPHAADPHAADPHADPHAADPHGPRVRQSAPAVVAVERSRAPSGRTVAEVFAQRSALAGKQVVVRATVVKATDGVLGKTYLHLQDGSGSAEQETHDLTATTTELFELGETVEVQGLLAIDQDVGLDYRYPALLGDVKRVR